MFYGNHYANFFKKFVQPSGQFSQRRLFNIFPSAPFCDNLVTWCGLGLNSIHPRWFLGFHLASDVVHLFRSSGRKMVSFFFTSLGNRRRRHLRLAQLPSHCWMAANPIYSWNTRDWRRIRKIEPRRFVSSLLLQAGVIFPPIIIGLNHALLGPWWLVTSDSR